jgi:hypothetical protein
MRPLKGVVMKGGQFLTILLETGQTIKAQNKHEQRVGDRVAAHYDFTTNTLVKVGPPIDEALDNNTEPAQNTVPYEPEEHHEEFWGWGALSPVGDGLETYTVILGFSNDILTSGCILWPHEHI